MNKYRDRKFCAVLYPEDETHVKAIETLKTNGYNFAAILHDRDIYEDGENKGQIKKAHWHVTIRFKNAVWNTSLSKDLGISENYLEACKDIDGSLLYMVHEGYPEKVQYDYQEVFGPIAIRLSSLLADQDEGTRVLNLCDIIENSPGYISFSELIRKSVSAGLYSDLRRMGSFAVHMVNEHNYEVTRQNQINAGVQQDFHQFRRYEETTGNKNVIWGLE